MPTRRTSRRTSRRASRALRSNARPIRPDPAIVKALMGEVRQGIHKFLEHAAKFEWRTDDPTLDGMFLMKQIPFKIKTVKNEIQNIKLLVRARYPEPREQATYLDVNEWRKGRVLSQIEQEMTHGVDGIIEIYYTPKCVTRSFLTWDNLLSDQTIETLQNALEHELIHAMDVRRGRVPLDFEEPTEAVSKFISEEDSPVDDSDFFYETYAEQRKRQDQERFQLRLYLTDKPELRAFMFNILEEIRELVRVLVQSRQNMRRRAQGKPSIHAPLSLVYEPAISQALERSDTWRVLEPHLSSKGRNLLLKGIVTALEDEGIIKIE